MMSSSRPLPPTYSPTSSSSASSTDPSKRARLVAFAKAKRNEFTPYAHQAAEASKSAFGRVATYVTNATDQSTGNDSNRGSDYRRNDDTLNMSLYPSYALQLGDGQSYEIVVRGWVYYYSSTMSRKERIYMMIMKGILTGSLDATNQALNASVAAATTQVTTGSSVLAGIAGLGAAAYSRPSANPRRNDEAPDLIDLNSDDDDDQSASKKPPPLPPRLPPRPKPVSESVTPPAPPLPTRTNSTTSTITNGTAVAQEEPIWKQRFQPFLARSKPNSSIKITLFNDDFALSSEFEGTTDANGRFDQRIKTMFPPTRYEVSVGDACRVSQSVSAIPQHGVSVISDIDDTVRITGVTKGKAEAMRNVFMADVKHVAVEGVADWYRHLASRGAKFHYVSNAPWPLFDLVHSFLRENNFPEGSIHLKLYSNFLQSIFEPGKEKKRSTLQKLLTDFPHRKFILIGDSGEHDLDAYVEIAMKFKNQVCAIYMRDVTLPLNDKTFEFKNESSAKVPPRHRVDRLERRPPPIPSKPAALHSAKYQETHQSRPSDNGAESSSREHDYRRRPVHVYKSNQEFDDQEQQSKQEDREQDWKVRVKRAQLNLDPSIIFRIWRTPQDLEKIMKMDSHILPSPNIYE